MGRRDFSEQIEPVSSLAPQTAATTVDGAAVGVTGFASATAIIDVGAFGGTSPTATIEIQDSPDGETWTAVAASDLSGGALPAIDDNTGAVTLERGYRGLQPFVRVSVTAMGGTSPELPICAVVVRSDPRALPI